ncbi:phage protein [Vibrio phage pTD1]|uniref:Phage protein n=1 Tax=Vibrio phage pTD1 TaxID=1938577 RepID=A0A1Q2U307_9CAUD|nr:phage protein [Vibrio phage pTD1]BAW98327.1 phage protein [Vibrio phage pTD1]
MNELNKLYVAITRTWNAGHDEDGKLYLELDGNRYPIRLDDMDVYLPFTSALESDTTEKVFFHPACESIISKETEIFRIIRKMAGLQILTHFKKFAPVLFDVANKKAKRGLRNDLLERIEVIKTAKTNQRKEVIQIFDHMNVEMEADDTVDRRFVHFDVKRGGRSKLTGDKIYYSCKPIFPFYNELVRRLTRTEGEANNRPVKLLGKEFTRGALVVAEEIFRFVLPGVEDPLAYEQEQVSAEAARFSVFVNTYTSMISDMNNLQNTFRAEFDKVGVYEIDTSYSTMLEDIDVIYKQVPPMPYNSQSSNNEVKTEVQTHQMVGSLMNQTSHITPNVGPTSVQTTTTGGLDAATNAANGFVNEVKAGLQPGETWIGVTQDPMSGHFIHSVQTMQGPVQIRYSRQGNFLSRESTMMAGMGMAGANPYGYNMNQMQMAAMLAGTMNPAIMGQPTYADQVSSANTYHPTTETPTTWS